MRLKKLKSDAKGQSVWSIVVDHSTNTRRNSSERRFVGFCGEAFANGGSPARWERKRERGGGVVNRPLVTSVDLQTDSDSFWLLLIRRACRVRGLVSFSFLFSVRTVRKVKAVSARGNYFSGNSRIYLERDYDTASERRGETMTCHGNVENCLFQNCNISSALSKI